jgi:hypothetical protein
MKKSVGCFGGRREIGYGWILEGLTREYYWDGPDMVGKEGMNEYFHYKMGLGKA